MKRRKNGLSVQCFRYIQWMRSQLKKYGDVDDELFADMLEEYTGKRSTTEITTADAQKIIPALKRKLRKLGIKNTGKTHHGGTEGTEPRGEERGLLVKNKKNNPDSAPCTPCLRGKSRPGLATPAQVNMIWTIARHLGMSTKVLMGFLEKRITGGRTGDPAELTQKEITHLKTALESRVQRGDRLTTEALSTQSREEEEKSLVKKQKQEKTPDSAPCTPCLRGENIIQVDFTRR